ncbi:cilia- and flagella-associated protein 46 [Melozone crissalis]|uniref:cilia- and flagella-associated protein 46 n=1 Tax=Melozone crissalis TaxID=40204 RepID=UPI0023DB14BC|nr:cilia- and flagella-associated protein 46 [Melozone crissalis]
MTLGPGARQFHREARAAKPQLPPGARPEPGLRARLGPLRQRQKPVPYPPAAAGAPGRARGAEGGQRRQQQERQRRRAGSAHGRAPAAPAEPLRLRGTKGRGRAGQRSPEIALLWSEAQCPPIRQCAEEPSSGEEAPEGPFPRGKSSWFWDDFRGQGRRQSLPAQPVSRARAARAAREPCRATPAAPPASAAGAAGAVPAGRPGPSSEAKREGERAGPPVLSERRRDTRRFCGGAAGIRAGAAGTPPGYAPVPRERRGAEGLLADAWPAPPAAASPGCPGRRSAPSGAPRGSERRWGLSPVRPGMELAVREQLLAAGAAGDVQALKHAYKLIKSASERESALNSTDNISTALYVLCAEQALQLGYLEISSDCLQMYFKGRFPVNQFLGRAYLCQGQLHAPRSTDNLEEFEKFVLFFMKAIDFATHERRYFFLVYNASVLYWQLVRPFLKPGFRHCLIPSLSQIVTALNQIEEQDHEWRAELMINLLECFLDASKLKEAKEFSSAAAAFIKENVPDKYSQIFSLMVYHKLMDISQVEKETQNSTCLSVIYKMQVLKLKWDTNVFPSDATANLNSLYELLKQCDVPPASVLNVKIPLILELARFSLKVNCTDLAARCILDLKSAQITEQGKLIEIECLEYEYEMKKDGTEIVTYTKGVVEAQLKLIKNLELALKRAIQLGDPGVIQVVCATLWNLCLPLLQHNLHQHLRKPLISVAAVLEEIDSMLILLRCQVHMEIARIEEDGDRLEAALEHVQKAMHLNNSGQYQEHLRLSFNRLRLGAMLYESPEHPEDQAVMLIEQAKRGKQKDNMRKKRSLLVHAGLALAPDTFQIVLDSENEAKVFSGKSNSQISYLCAKAQHHTRSVKKVDEHLKHLKNGNCRERIILWADLAKVACKQEVWNVCRAACRFCLLYDDILFREATKHKQTQKNKANATVMMDGRAGSASRKSLLPAKSFSFEADLLRILAEIRFINAEATVHLLRLQGVKLNDHAVPPAAAYQSRPGHVSYLPDSDPEWKTYSLWIDSLSQYAMENFQRAAEIGEELNEAWIVHNAVVYTLNYNRHVISSGRQRDIIEYLQTLLGAIKTVRHDGSTEILLMLCNALARALIISWIPKPKSAEKIEETPVESSRKAAAKKQEKENIIQSFSVDPSGLPDIKAALEICEFALNAMTKTTRNEKVSLAAHQQIIATWVKAKQLNQQQIRHQLGTRGENNDEVQNLQARILVGLEMYSCNGLGLMDFTLPSLSQLLDLALECSWSDSLVELQTLTRLTYFAYVSQDYERVMTCSKRILESDENFLLNRNIKKYGVLGNSVRQEMLSIAACIKGKSIMENLSGRKHLRVAASQTFVQSARHAGEAGNYSLVIFAAAHFWNACLPLLGSPHDREQFKGPIKIILKSIIKAESKNKQGKKDTCPLHQWITKDFQNIGLSVGCFLPGAEEDLALRTSLYGLLFHIYADKADWETALKLLDEAIQVLPQTRHKLLIFKLMATVRAGSGCCFTTAIQKASQESEDYLSHMWRHLVMVSRSIVGQLSCFQNAIIALQKQKDEWQRVDYLMEFAECLYCNQFPLNDAIKPLQWAIDLLLCMEFPMQSSQEEESNAIPELLPTENAKMDNGANGTTSQMNLEDLSNIKQLEALFRAQTLMALFSGRGSSFHQQHCLMAYACIVRIWQVSLSASGIITKAFLTQHTSHQKVQSKTPKKDKDKKKEKQVEVSKEKPKGKESVDYLPENVEEWAQYDCPNEIRDIFKQKTNGYGINWDNFPKPTCTLYFMDLLSKELQKIFCPHLILPVFQLAEVIASEVLECRSLSDLYHLRIALICSDLKLNQASVYHEKAAGDVYISELEQAMCRQEIALEKEKNVCMKTEERKVLFENAQLNGSRNENVLTSRKKGFEVNAVTGKGLSALSFPRLWIEKAEILIQLGLYQPARLLLSEAHAAAQELRALCDMSRCLYLLAVLANLERNHRQAKALLEKAQLLGGDEQFWYNSTLSLTEAILEEEGEGKQSMACEILEHTVSVLRSTLLKRPGRQSELGFMIASLEARKALIQIHFAQDHMTIDANSAQLHILQESYNKLIQLEKDFLHHGHKNYSAELLLECANICWKSAKQERNKRNKHSHYLDAYSLAQRAVSKTEEVFHNVCSLFAFNESKNVSIPLMRQLALRKINLVEILLDIFHLVITEKKFINLGEESFHEFMEEISIEGDAIEQDWKYMKRTMAHITLAQLANTQNLCKGCPNIESKCLYLSGKTLHLLAINVDPIYSEIYWKPNVTEDAISDTRKSSLTSAECSEQDVTESGLSTNKCQSDEYRRKIQELKTQQRMAQKYLSQSNEALLQSVAIAFNYNVTDVLALASLEMAECFRQFDPILTSQYLALHQSCSVSVIMKNILLTATSNTSSSQLAALLHLQNQLKQNRNTSDLLKCVEQQLTANSLAWRNLCIPVEHFNIVDELPSSFCIVILQHSEDRSQLYSSLIEVPKVSTAKQKGKPPPRMVQAKVSRFPVNPDAFRILLEKMRLYKDKRMKNHLKQTLTHNLKECVSKTDVTPTEKTGDSELDLTSDFSEIIERMEEYLKPTLSQFDFSAIRESRCVSVSASETGKKKVKDKDTKQGGIQDAPVDLGLSVVLLGDALLMELPLEALSVFKDEGISSVSRDFSLQFLYNRLHWAESENELKKKVETSKEKTTKTQQKKNVQMAPVNRDLPSNCLSVDTRNLKYIVDPYNEGREAEALSPSRKLQEILEKYRALFKVQWEGVIGRKCAPSQAEWEQLLTSCSAFLFYGMERFMSHVLLNWLVAMNIPKCRLVILLDLVRSQQSYQRIANADLHKSCARIALERPTETAMLLSLAGVGCVVAPQWYTDLEENAGRLEALFENLLSFGRTTGQTIHVLQKSRSHRKRHSMKMEADSHSSPEDKIEEQTLCPSSDPPASHPSCFNCVLYGLPNIILM